jgi:hypothetical protein
MTNADYRQAKADGATVAWRDIAAVYDAIAAADVIAMQDELQRPAEPVARRAPAHMVRASGEYALALETWQAGLSAAVAGGRTVEHGGRPARGETFTDEETAYRASNPKPVWLDYVRAESAANLHGANA